MEKLDGISQFKILIVMWVMQFFMGLNESYGVVKRSILMMNPLSRYT